MRKYQSSIINHQSSNTEDPLYREIILEHWQHPLNYGVIKNPDFKITGNNPTCGDTIEIYGKINKGKLIDIKFTCKGCAISKASASLLSEKVKGIKIKDFAKLDEAHALNLLPLEITPARHNCALLFFRTSADGIK